MHWIPVRYSIIISIIIKSVLGGSKKHRRGPPNHQNAKECLSPATNLFNFALDLDEVGINSGLVFVKNCGLAGLVALKVGYREKVCIDSWLKNLVLINLL